MFLFQMNTRTQDEVRKIILERQAIKAREAAEQEAAAQDRLLARCADDLQRTKVEHPALGPTDKVAMYGYLHSRGLLYRVDMAVASAEGQRWVRGAYDRLLTQADHTQWEQAGATGTELLVTCGKTGVTRVVIKTLPFSLRPPALHEMRCALQDYDTRPRPDWEIKMNAEIEAELAAEKAALVGKKGPSKKKERGVVIEMPSRRKDEGYKAPMEDTRHPSHTFIFPGVLSDVPVPAGNSWQQHLKNAETLFDLWLEPFAKREMPSPAHMDRVSRAVQACLGYRPHHDPIFKSFYRLGLGD